MIYVTCVNEPMKNATIARVFQDMADLGEEEGSCDYIEEGKVYNR